VFSINIAATFIYIFSIVYYCFTYSAFLGVIKIYIGPTEFVKIFLEVLAFSAVIIYTIVYLVGFARACNTPRTWQGDNTTRAYISNLSWWINMQKS